MNTMVCLCIYAFSAFSLFGGPSFGWHRERDPAVLGKWYVISVKHMHTIVKKPRPL